MKKTLLFALVAVALISSCKANDTKAAASGDTAATTEKAEATAKPASKADVSYAFGVAIGNSIKGTAVALDYTAFVNGVKDVLDKDKTKVTMDEANMIIQTAIQDAQVKQGEVNAAKEKEFFTANGKKTGVKTTASGLQYEVITEGTGSKPVETDTVKVNYVGTFTDGKTFDSSIERGEPAQFPLNQVIPGWTEGIQLMNVGSKYKFYIPSSLGYGPEGAGGVIAPYSTLIFEVDLLSIENP